MELDAQSEERSQDQPASEWWKGAVIYQIYPRSFFDSNNDGIGDLPGITARLEYVASLGVDAIWLSPFFTSPMRDFGYDVADYRGVDPIFGTLDDFDVLLERAHALGLKVLIDQVYSHTSEVHAWFQQSRSSRSNEKADWYVWADAKPDGSPPNNWQSVFGGPSWTWDARRGQYYMHNFLPEQPDLNVHNPAVQEELLDTMRFWLDRGVDGIRLDAVNFMMHDPALHDNPPIKNTGTRRTRPFDFQHHYFNQSHPDIPAFLERMRVLADSYEGRFLVAEVGGERAQEEMELYTRRPGRLHSAYGFLYLYAESLDPALVGSAVDLWPSDGVTGWPSWTFSNHDAPRAVSRWAAEGDREAFANMALLLLVAMRGNVFIYQGEELGLPQAMVPFDRLQDPEAIANWPQTLGRDGARTPMPWTRRACHGGFSEVEPWLPVDARHFDLAVDAQEADAGATLHLARRFVRLRERHSVLRTGAMRMVETGVDGLLAFERGSGDRVIFCVFNLTCEPVSWDMPAGWKVIEQVNAAGGDGCLPAYAGVLAQRI
ncbi:alpha-glucosidase [Maricaulis maris]|uniref:Alpha-glucosidase n=1 Tax=Maricaulis maris TaxID=74318 RepID=A0A495CZD4_9PROT|nr:alpha-glucosidase [Maricaulis maris]RKQ94120.1 alpha-glucosidase [Maricaulis maris]